MCICLYRYSVTVLRSIFYFTDESTSQDQDRSLATTTVSLQSSCKSTSTLYMYLATLALYYNSQYISILCACPHS